VWAIQANRKMLSTINETYLGNYAVIGMHSGGGNGFGINMYDILFEYISFEWNVFWENYAVTSRPFGYHHAAFLISNNQKIYRYYWSIRDNSLMLDGSGEIPLKNSVYYHYVENESLVMKGVKVSRDLNSENISWYIW